MRIAFDDGEWRQCLEEAKDLRSLHQVCEFFVFICALNMPTNAIVLWNELKDFVSEDYASNYSQDAALNRALFN